jgi:transcriptional regulator with XRE-family HTH domain
MSRRKRPENVELEPTYLAAWRKHKRYTLRRVAQHIGIDATAISRLERHQTPYDQVHLQQLRDLYGVTIPDLLYTDPERPKANAEVVELVKRLDRPADIAAVKMFVEAMLSRK